MSRIFRRCAAVWLAAGLAAGLSGCGDGSSAPANGEQPQHKEVTIRNQPQERLLALPDNLRRVTLVRAIRATGNRCPRRVEPNPVHQGDYRGMAVWTARCDNNRQYAVFIAPNEDVQVRRCEDMGQLGLPACRSLPPAVQAPERPRAKAE